MTIIHAGGINAAISATLSGMQRAVERLELAAIRMANTAPPPERPALTPPIPREGIGTGIAAIQGQEAVDTAMVNVMVAKRAYEANAKTLRALAEDVDWPFNRGF